MIERKTLLLAGALAALALVSVPSVMFNNAIREYFSVVDSWSVATIKPSRQAQLPQAHKREKKSGEIPLPELRFVKFSVRISGAKKVKVAADFNKWDPDSLPLVKKDRGLWETIVPLPPGKYRYIYYIDGAQVLDPMNPETDTSAGRKCSLLTVN